MTSFTKLEEKLKEIVFNQDIHIHGRRLKDLETNFTQDTVFDDIGISSGTIQTVKLIMDLEDNFEIEIDDGHMDELNTIRKITSYMSTNHNIQNI